MGSIPSTNNAPNNGLSDLLQTLTNENSLFGISTSNDTSASSLFSALAAVGSSGGTPSTTVADQLAAYQGSQQTQEAQTLLGINKPTTTSNSLFDVFA